MVISKLEIPILQAPVEANVDLAAAVSAAGGMGSIQELGALPTKLLPSGM